MGHRCCSQREMPFLPGTLQDPVNSVKITVYKTADYMSVP
jgi:hypothetical protein